MIGFDLVYEATQHFSNENKLGEGGCSLQPDDDEGKVRLPCSYVSSFRLVSLLHVIHFVGEPVIIHTCS